MRPVGTATTIPDRWARLLPWLGALPYLVVMIFPLTLALLFTAVRREHHLSWQAAG
jgi:hypothetical protein